jgi:hypothetical protein
MIERRAWAPCLFSGTILLATLLLPVPASPRRQGGQQPQSQPSEQPAQKPQDPDPAATGQSQPGQSHTDDGSSKTQGQEEGTSPKNERLFGVLPNNLTVGNAAKVPPLTSGGKFKLVSKNAFDPVIFPFVGFIALIGQAQNSDPGYGQGAAGYAKRYGASFGDSTIGTFMTGAIFPSVFKQDPRYYRLGHGGFGRRAGYSVTRIVITRSDSGQRQLNSSEILGNFVAAGISNVYHPASDRSFQNTLKGWGTDTGWDLVAGLGQEFWPDIHAWLKKKFASGGHH